MSSRQDIARQLRALDEDTVKALESVTSTITVAYERAAGGVRYERLAGAEVVASSNVAVAAAVRAHMAYTADGLHEVADAIIRSSRTTARDTGYEREERMRDRIALSRDLEALARSIVVAARPPRPSANERIRAARRGRRIS